MSWKFCIAVKLKSKTAIKNIIPLRYWILYNFSRIYFLLWLKNKSCFLIKFLKKIELRPTDICVRSFPHVWLIWCAFIAARVPHTLIFWTAYYYLLQLHKLSFSLFASIIALNSHFDTFASAIKQQQDHYYWVLI